MTVTRLEVERREPVLGGRLASPRDWFGFAVPVLTKQLMETRRPKERFSWASTMFIVAALLILWIAPLPVAFAALAFLGLGDGKSVLRLPIVERATQEMLPLANMGWGTRRGARRPLYTQQGSLVTERTVRAEQYGRFLIAIFDEWWESGSRSVAYDVLAVYVSAAVVTTGVTVAASSTYTASTKGDARRRPGGRARRSDRCRPGGRRRRGLGLAARDEPATGEGVPVHRGPDRRPDRRAPGPRPGAPRRGSSWRRHRRRRARPCAPSCSARPR